MSREQKTLTFIGLLIVAAVVVGMFWALFRIKKVPAFTPVVNPPAQIQYTACAPDQIAYKQGIKQCDCGGWFEYWDDGNTYCRDVK